METVEKILILVFCLGMQAVTVGISSYAFGFFVLPWMETFSVSRADLMLAVSIAAVVLLFLAPIGGILVDRFNSRRVVVTASAIFSLGLATISQAQGHWLIILMFSTCLPIGAVLAGPLMAQTLVAHRFIEKRGLAMGMVALGSSIGGAVIPMLVTALLASYDWRQVFIILSVLTVVTITVPATLLLQGRSTKIQTKQRATAGFQLTPDILGLGFGYFAIATPFISILNNLGAYAGDMGLTSMQAAKLASIAFGASVTCKLIVGWLSDHVRERQIYIALATIAASGVMLTCNAKNFTELGCGVLLSAAAAGAMMPLISAVVARRYPADRFGRAIGLVHAFAALAGIAPSFSAYMRDISGSYYFGFLYLLVPIVPAVFVFVKSCQHNPSMVRKPTM